MDESWGKVSDIALTNRIMRAEDDDGVVELFVPANGVLICRVKGLFTESHAVDLARASSSVDTPVIHYFGDWELMKSYETPARNTMVNWGRHERKRLKSGTFIVGTRIVEMGVTVGSMAMALIGIDIKATTREVFNEKLTALCLAQK